MIEHVYSTVATCGLIVEEETQLHYSTPEHYMYVESYL